MDIGMLILRLVLGLLMAGHGAQKFGALGGGGLERTAAAFDAAGHRPGRQMAVVAGVLEIASGTLLVVGLATTAAGAAVLGLMVVACSMHWANGLWSAKGGIEMPLLYAAGGVTLAYAGPGVISLDHAFGLDDVAGLGWGLLATAIAGAAASGQLLRRSSVRRRSASAAT